MKNHKANAVRVICTAVNNFTWQGEAGEKQEGVQRGELRHSEGSCSGLSLASWRISRCLCESILAAFCLWQLPASCLLPFPTHPLLHSPPSPVRGIYINEKKTLNVQRSKLCATRSCRTWPHCFFGLIQCAQGTATFPSHDPALNFMQRLPGNPLNPTPPSLLSLHPLP